MASDVYTRALARLGAGEIFILDGGVGTDLERRGAAMADGAWCGPAALNAPEILEAVHVDYLRAGAQIVTANTYAASRVMMRAAGLEERTVENVERAVEIAHKARAAAGAPDALVAGSLSHMAPIQAGTAVPDANGPSRATLAEAYEELALLLRAQGCDVILLEMMYDRNRIPLAVDAALKAGLPIWIGYAARAGADGAPIAFDPFSETPLDEIVALGARAHADVAGIMHTPTSLIAAAMHAVAARHEGPLMAYPDSGRFEMPHWRFDETFTPDDLFAAATAWIRDGVRLVGGCCGVGPEHIRALNGLRAAGAMEGEAALIGVYPAA